MITIGNNDNKEIKLRGTIEGFNIISHIVNNAVNTSNTQPDYSQADVTIRSSFNGRDRIFYAGRLDVLIQGLLLRKFDSSKRINYLVGSIGQCMIEKGESVIEEHLADLSVYFDAMEADWTFQIRTKQVFPVGEENSSYIMIQYNVSDDACISRFLCRLDSVEKTSSVKSIQFEGNVDAISWIQSDNELIANNVGAYNGKNVHPLASVTCSSPMYNQMLQGAELQVLAIDDATDALPLMKSLILSDRDILIQPKLDMQLNTASFDDGVSYNIFSTQLLSIAE